MTDTEREAREIIRILVKETPFKPSENGILIEINFDLIKRMQAVVRGKDD